MQRCLGCMREFGVQDHICPHCGYVVGTRAFDGNYLQPGAGLGERYTLGRALGQDRFGVTYIAWDAVMRRAVTIKEFMFRLFVGGGYQPPMC